MPRVHNHVCLHTARLQSSHAISHLKHMRPTPSVHLANILPMRRASDWSSLGDYTVLLCLFSAAAVKGMDTRLLALSLLGEAHSTLCLLGILQV